MHNALSSPPDLTLLADAASANEDAVVTAAADAMRLFMQPSVRLTQGLNLDLLSNLPSIVGNVGPRFVSKHFTTVELVGKLPTKKGNRYIDSTDEGDVEKLAAMGSFLIKDYEGMMARIKSGMQVLGFAPSGVRCSGVRRVRVRVSVRVRVTRTLTLTPGCGVVPANQYTYEHQHILGVMHVMGMPLGWDITTPCPGNLKDVSKIWELKAPTKENKDQGATALTEIRLTQYPGDVLWLPPGWHHRLGTPAP
jgi:hypothetical protein